MSSAIQYFTPLYRELARRPEIDLTRSRRSCLAAPDISGASSRRLCGPSSAGFRGCTLVSRIDVIFGTTACRTSGSFLHAIAWIIVSFVNGWSSWHRGENKFARHSGSRSAVEDAVERRRIPNVLMPGFLNQTERPKAYTAADIFVLPSAFQETWGLVVNEAMNFPLPIIVSGKAGCAEDLVRPRWNGFVIPHRNIEVLAEAIARLVGDEGTRLEFGERSLRLISEYSIEACADGIVAAYLTARPRDLQQGIDSGLTAVRKNP